MIELKHITKVYGNFKALDDVSVTIRDGEIYGIVGQSGAGKSTLVRCINMLEPPTTGEVLINGKDMMKLSKAELRSERKGIGMIFQHFNLLSSRTVAGNIAFPLELANVPKAEQKKRIDDILEMVGLTEYKDKYPAQLSGGQKQRVGIARAIVSNPSVLLSDEATSALDPETVKSILQLLKDINKKLGITIIMITHQMEVIKEIAERVAVIEHGRIIEEGSVVDLFTNPQTPTLKKFVGSVMSSEVPEQLSHMDIHADKENADDQTVLSLSFRGDVANEPIIANLIKKYNLDVSILYGSIDYIQNVSFGRLIITIIGNDSDTKEALSHLKSLPITSEVLGYVSSH
ncbi:MAG: methionine ABC transporter ATP-binding protein [Dialister sp.]|nr:methionine ABC transporter ATP-binding protein [Dialister sp.]MDY4877279.1 methionine ABC transporter ATP-binding protein [Dialister sp.]